MLSNDLRGLRFLSLLLSNGRIQCAHAVGDVFHLFKPILTISQRNPPRVYPVQDVDDAASSKWITR
jgi:hypothetical protein